MWKTLTYFTFTFVFNHQELAERYAPQVSLSVPEVGVALESIRVQAVNRGKGNKTFRETNVASLELLLPRDARKVETQRKPSVCHPFTASYITDINNNI